MNIYKRTSKKIAGYRRTEWQLPALERDNFQCTECGTKEKLLVVFKEFNGVYPLKESDMKLDNLITKCRRCIGQGLPSAKPDRNKHLLALYAKNNIQQTAKLLGLTHQRVQQITSMAKKRGEADFSEIILQRKQEAIKVADTFNQRKNSINPQKSMS